jgi:8-oxo-dGTP pyrophosphatase MutT (NUDIX family)
VAGDESTSDARPRIPRPADFTLGRPAGWEALAPDVRKGCSLERVLGGLARVGRLVPVPDDPEGMVADLDPVVDALVPRHDRRRSAVLVLLFEEAGETRIILTRRSTRLNAHSGEISFPGGRVEDAEDFVAAAVREANEEVHLDPATIDVAGWLSPLVTVASGSFIQPIVAVANQRPTLEASPDEVARIFDVALADLMAPGIFHEERWRRGDRPARQSADGSFPLFFFAIADEVVWGATGRICYELCHLAVGLDAVIA